MEQHGESPALFRRLRQKESEQQELSTKLAEARLRERDPKSAAFAEMVTLVDIATSEQHRLRLRELLRTIIESIWILIVPRRSHRLCAAQVFFEGGGRRDYLIHYQAAAHCRPGGWCTCSLPAEVRPGDLDFRREADAGELRALLSEIDITLLTDAMRARPS
jgi:hypothetical protein